MLILDHRWESQRRKLPEWIAKRKHEDGEDDRGATMDIAEIVDQSVNK